jgi:hypothetical protein
MYTPPAILEFLQGSPLVYFPPLIFFVSVIFTVFHAAEELWGPGGPLWRNFGRIVGLDLPDLLGFLSFTVGLSVMLFGVAFGAYCFDSGFWVSVLIGARLGDCLISHWSLSAIGLSSPNPGIYSTTLYAAEGIWLICWLAEGALTISLVGIVLGGGFFALVLPSLYLLRILIPVWAEDSRI